MVQRHADTQPILHYHCRVSGVSALTVQRYNATLGRRLTAWLAFIQNYTCKERMQIN